MACLLGTEVYVDLMQTDIPSHSRDQIAVQLRALLPELRECYGVRSLSMFGSRVHDAGGPGSDLDLLVEFDQAPGFFRFIELEDRLGRHLGLKVDLVMKTALRQRIGQRVLAEAIPV